MNRRILLLILLVVGIVASAEQEIRIDISKAFSGNAVTDQAGYIASLRKDKTYPGGSLVIKLVSNGVRYGGGRITISGVFFDRKNFQINRVYSDAVVESEDMKVPYLPNGKYGVGLNIEGVRYFGETVTINSNQVVCEIALKTDDEKTISGRVKNIPEWADSALVKHGPYAAKVTPEGNYSLKTRDRGSRLCVDISVVRRLKNEMHRELLWVGVPFSANGENIDIEVPRFAHSDSPVVSGTVVIPDEMKSQGFGKVIQNTSIYLRRSDGGLDIHIAPSESGEFKVYDILDGSYIISTDGPAGNIPWISDDLKVEIKNGQGSHGLILNLR